MNFPYIWLFWNLRFSKSWNYRAKVERVCLDFFNFFQFWNLSQSKCVFKHNLWLIPVEYSMQMQQSSFFAHRRDKISILPSSALVGRPTGRVFFYHFSGNVVQVTLQKYIKTRFGRQPQFILYKEDDLNSFWKWKTT